MTNAEVRADAIAVVSEWGATAVRPVIASETLGQIIDRAARADGNGRAPSDPDWVAVYDLNAATAEVWRIKAGRVAADFNFKADGADISKGDVLAHMTAMEAKYAALVGTGLPTAGSAGAGTITLTPPLGGRSTLDAVAAKVIP